VVRPAADYGGRAAHRAVLSMPERRFPPPWTVEEAKARRIAAKCGKAAARLAAPP